MRYPVPVIERELVRGILLHDHRAHRDFCAVVPRALASAAQNEQQTLARGKRCAYLRHSMVVHDVAQCTGTGLNPLVPVSPRPRMYVTLTPCGAARHRVTPRFIM